MSEPKFIYTFKFGETVVAVRGRNRIEAKQKVKAALGWLPDVLTLAEVVETPND